MMIIGECIRGWNWESQRAELSQEHPEGKCFGSKLQFVPCFLTPSTQHYMKPRSVDSSLLPVLRGFSFFLFPSSSFTVSNLIFWLHSQRWEKLSLSLVFQPCPEALIGLLLYTFQLLGRAWVFSLSSSSLSSSCFSTLCLLVVQASKMFLGFWCIYFNLAVSMAQQ